MKRKPEKENQKRKEPKEKNKRAERDRINIILPKGTNDRIDALGFKRSDFAKTLILTELDKLESMKK